MADMTAPSSQAPAVALPVRTDEEIVPRIRWVPIGKSNCSLDLDKKQSNPIFKMAVDLLMHTNFYRAFTASSTIPCQLDEQWFVLTKDTLREALQITPVNNNQAFVAPPSADVLVDFVNQLGYPKLVRKRRHKFYPRPDSPLYLPNEEPVLGYLKFSAKGSKREVFGMPIPGFGNPNAGSVTLFGTMISFTYSFSASSSDKTWNIILRLKTKRIFRNLESFVGGRVRGGDYRLLKCTE
nr:hypothetical protein [Tanacetum cinerariifolium]